MLYTSTDFTGHQLKPVFGPFPTHFGDLLEGAGVYLYIYIYIVIYYSPFLGGIQTPLSCGAIDSLQLVRGISGVGRWTSKLPSFSPKIAVVKTADLIQYNIHPSSTCNLHYNISEAEKQAKSTDHPRNRTQRNALEIGRNRSNWTRS